MASVRTVSASTRIEISSISTLNFVWSPEVLVQGLPWQVKVRKMDSKQSIGVYLHCAKKEKPKNWTHAASASIKLLPYNGNQNSIEYNTEPFVFDDTDQGFGNPSLIRWHDLFKNDSNFLKDDSINLEIKIEAEDANRTNRSALKFENIDRSCADGCVASFRLTVNNIESLMAVRSPQFTLRNIQWNLTVRKDHSSNLCVFLHQKSSRDISCKINMTAKLMALYENGKSLEKIRSKNVTQLSILSTDKLTSWDELLKPENGFVKDNAIVIEVEIKSDQPDPAAVPGDSGTANLRKESKLLKLECAICLENIDKQEISVTLCGHLFCTACITTAVNNHGACPSCNKAIILDTLRRTYLPIMD